MKIIAENNKYHRFAFYYDFSLEKVEFCQKLKESFGWKKFSFNSDDGLKRWIFSDSLLVPVIQEKYPGVMVDPEVASIVEKEQAWATTQKEQIKQIDKVKNKTETDFDVKGLKQEMYDYQRVGVEFLVASGGRAIVADAMGCLSGKTKIIINRGGGARTYSIADAYIRFNRKSSNKKYNWELPSFTRSYNEKNNEFCLNRIDKIIYSGKKETIEITAKNKNKKYTIQLTPDHKIMTPNGWVEAGKLKKEDKILTNGKLLKYCSICKKITPHSTYRYGKNLGECKKCIYRFKRDNHNNKNYESYDKNGYVLVGGLYFHPSFTRFGDNGIRKYILVYEAFLNKVSYKDWVRMCRTNSFLPNAQFINSKKNNVHHKNGIKSNNCLKNLSLLSVSKHSQLEGKQKTYRNLKATFIPTTSKIISIRKKGVQDTYDIAMNSPYNSFIANGIVVHNCGKTIQALAYAKHMGFQRTLVICPASVKFSWKLEINKWTNLSCTVVNSKTKIAEIDPSIKVWLVNYDILKKHFKTLVKTRFDCIVGDECQYLKSLTAQRSKAFRMIAQNIPSVILLSGTPLLSRAAELFSLLNIIDCNTWSNYYEYVRRYCDAHQTRWGLDVSGSSNKEELHNRIKSYFIRRDKTEVLKELPPKSFIDVPVELDSEHLKKYDSAAKNFADYLRTYEGKQPPEIAQALEAEKLSQLNVLRRINALGKVKMAKELIESIIESGEKVLIFASFVAPLEELKEYFGDKAVILTGKTKVEDRQQIVEDFQNNDKIKVFLGGYKSAGIGITLTAASSVVFLDFSWLPSDHEQSQDRAHRIGTKHQCINIYQLYSTSSSIDDDLREMHKNKQEIFDTIIEGKNIESVSKKAKESAIKRILANY